MRDDDPVLSFPDRAHGELDRSVVELVENAQRVLESQGRLRSLFNASRVVADELELGDVLRTIIQAAVDLVDARFGAIGVIAPDGTLEQFIHVGMPADTVSRIGHLPQGLGLLGALIDDQSPIRLEHLQDDPRSIGFPAGHPHMDSFLGVPVQVRGEIFGNLYLAERAGGSFTEEDQELVVALAATAGSAIDRARLFDETVRRQRWATASAEITAAVLSDEAPNSLEVLIDRVRVLASADLVGVVAFDTPTTFRVDIARGSPAVEVPTGPVDARGTLAGRARDSGQPVMFDGAGPSPDDPLAIGPTMAVPLISAPDESGVLVVSRAAGRARFTEADLDMAADFAAQASVALRMAAGRADRARLATLEDRGRIARDLHDHVIQRLYGAGLTLQAIAASTDAALSDRILAQVDSLDAAIADIRTAIFSITAPRAINQRSLRHRVIDLVAETSSIFHAVPRLTFSGPIDLVVEDALADDLVAVIREGITNIARHAQASTVDIDVSVSASTVTVTIRDDGVGIDFVDPEEGSGIRNLSARAQARGGSFAVGMHATKGTIVTWTAPLEAAG